MRIVLSVLMCFVLSAAECFAIGGGPPYPAGTNLVGTYAGVLQPAFCPQPNPANCPGLNSIGVFSLGVPSSGMATGTFVMFSQGRVFSGTATAFANPNNATLKGILQASYNYNLYVPSTTTDSNGNTTTTLTTVPVTASANGPINATVSASKSSGLFGTSTTLVTGTATLNITGGYVDASGNPIINSALSLVVSGVKQSNTAPASSTGVGSGG